ncbi:MAG: NAD(P)/FAD-dependent oxidoreductase [Leptospirales bacterium]
MNRHVVIVGGGFAGLAAARTLENHDVSVSLVDSRNYHLFQPLLYQVASGDLNAEALATPIRRIYQKNKVRFHLGTVIGWDFEQKTVLLEGGTALSYDRLMLALGTSTNFFGKKGIEKHAYQLKGLPEAEALRSQVLLALERASQCRNTEERSAWLSFVIAGGGTTGVEFSCALLELFRVLLPRDYPEINPREVSVQMIQGENTLLPGFSPSLRTYAATRLTELGCRIRFETHVEDFDGLTVSFNKGAPILSRTLVWAAGVTAHPLLDSLPGKKLHGGRIRVNDQFQLPVYPDVFVLGDIASRGEEEDWPQVAPFAIQSGRHGAQSVLSSWNLARSPGPFCYQDPGSMVVLGRFDAVCQIPRWKIKWHGPVAWVLWLFLHLYYIMGTRNRALTLIDWGTDYLFHSAAVELIRHQPPANRPGT